MNAPPTILRVNGRDVVVDTTPLSDWVLNSNWVTLKQPRSHLLVVRVVLISRLLCGLCGVIGLFPLLLAFHGLTNSDPVTWEVLLSAICPGVIGTGMVAVGLLSLLVAGRHEFDRETGQWRQHEYWTWGTCRRLTDILAVQILDRDRPSLKAEGLPTWQVNLILDDAEKPRQNLLLADDEPAARRLANRVAQFLRVPVLGPLATPRPAAEAETSNPSQEDHRGPHDSRHRPQD